MTTKEETFLQKKTQKPTHTQRQKPNIEQVMRGKSGNDHNPWKMPFILLSIKNHYNIIYIIITIIIITLKTSCSERKENKMKKKLITDTKESKKQKAKEKQL